MNGIEMLVDLIKKTIPEFTTCLPTLKRNIKYRPLLVKEEKNISEIMSLSRSTEEKIFSLCEIVNSCCDYQIDAKELSIVDFQHLLIEIRKKSVKESSNIRLNCPSTGEQVSIKIDLDEVIEKNKNKKSEMEIEINKKLKIKIQSPKLKTILQLNSLDLENNFIYILANSILDIETEKEKLDLNLYSIEEKIKFVELIDRSNYKEIKDFMYLNLYNFNLSYTTSDGVNREVVINDFVNFFKFYLAMLI